jgi:hypothetical protein
MPASKRLESGEKTLTFGQIQRNRGLNLQRNRHGNAPAWLDTPESRVLASFPVYRRTLEQMVRFSFEHYFKESYLPLPQGSLIGSFRAAIKG